MPKSVNWKIAGSAGLGIKSTGEIMAKALARSGFKVFGYTEYPSLIRGGHNTYQLWADESGATAPRKILDVLVALNQDGIDLHLEEMNEETRVIADKSLKTEGIKAKIISVDIEGAVRTLGEPLVKNTVTIGVSAAEMGLAKEVFKELIETVFGNKPKLIEMNLNAFEAGYRLHPNPKISTNPSEAKNLVLTGNEAVGLGAIAAGLQLYAGYPMTPTTPLLHFLAEHQDRYGYVVRQTEDEISAINTITGAAYAGAKVMTATSGGGFDLMQEGMSLIGMLELPVVVDLGMRGGPATGLPTWTSQSDLRLAIHSGHGEYPRIVLAPGDAGEAYELAHLAFLYAQKFQVGVILLTDKHLNESHYTVEELKNLTPVPLMNVELAVGIPEGEMYHRYQPTADGISKRTLPGVKGGFYIANSDEHEATGLSDESKEVREMMVRKRLLKMERIKSEMMKPEVYGKEGAKLTLVGFGSTKGSILEALKELNDVAYVHLHHVWPLPDSVGETLKDRELLVIENNSTGQLRGLLRETFGFEAKAAFLRDDGRPFYADEIIEFVKGLK